MTLNCVITLSTFLCLAVIGWALNFLNSNILLFSDENNHTTRNPSGILPIGATHGHLDTLWNTFDLIHFHCSICNKNNPYFSYIFKFLLFHFLQSWGPYDQTT